MGAYAPPDELRCTFIKRSGARCRQERLDSDSPEVTWCKFHTHTMLSTNNRAYGHALEKFKAGDVQPADALMEELRRTQVMIEMFQHELAEMEIEQFHEVVTRETKTGMVDTYTRTLIEQRAHPLLTTLQWERSHLAQTARLALQSGIEQQQLELNQALAGQLVMAIQNVLRCLGIPDGDPRARPIVLQSMEAARRGELLPVRQTRIASLPDDQS